MKRSAVLLLTAVVACSVDPEQATGTCAGVADCDLGYVCKQPDAQCVPEPPNTFSGRFECTVLPSSSAELGQDDILGNVGERRIAVNGGTSCRRFTSISGDSLAIASISSVTTGGVDYMLNIVLPFGEGGAFEMRAPLKASSEQYTASVVEYLDQQVTGFAALSSGGVVQLDQPVVMDGPLSGYVEIGVVAPHDGTIVGIPCPNGFADCGNMPSTLTGVQCTQPDAESDWVAFCTRLCQTDSECEEYGGACALASAGSGVCMRPCTTDEDCVAPHTCVELNYAARTFCFHPRK